MNETPNHSVTLDEAKDWCGVSDNASDPIITELISTAEDYIKSAVSITVDLANPRVKTLVKTVVYDFYSNRGTTESNKIKSSTKRLVSSFISQLQLENLSESEGEQIE